MRTIILFDTLECSPTRELLDVTISEEVAASYTSNGFDNSDFPIEFAFEVFLILRVPPSLVQLIDLPSEVTFCLLNTNKFVETPFPIMFSTTPPLPIKLSDIIQIDLGTRLHTSKESYGDNVSL
jgi:hypothetical protein